MNKKNAMKATALAAAGVMIVGGALGASAYFTDKATVSNKANVGTMNMVLSDYSDLDGNYASWGDVDGTWTATKALTTTGYQGTSAAAITAYDADNPSTDIINPGDTGILQFSIANDREKSMDTAAEIVLTSTVELTDDADEYTIEGLGTPVKSDDGKTLTYRVELDTINGSVETEDGGLSAGDEHFYAYNVDFSRLAANKFQDADFSITVSTYAKQHRNSPDSTFANSDDENSDGYSDESNITGDWTMIGSYEITSSKNADAGKVILVEETDAANTDVIDTVDPE